MVDRFIGGCLAFMIRRGAVADTAEQREIYSYGLELQVYYFIHAAMLLFIGLLFGRSGEVALLLLLFGLIQSNGGGFHAGTHGRCLALMAAGAALFLLVLPLFERYALLQAASVHFGAAVTLALAPVSHKNHPLSPEKSKELGKRAKLLACAVSFIWGILALAGVLPVVRGVASAAMLFTGVSILAAWARRGCLKEHS